MVRTFGGGLQAVSAEMQHVGEYMHTLSQAVLLSARGNSGVIFSQFVSGLARGFSGCDRVSFPDFVRAFDCAREDAYRAILTPTEGTILTVIREAAAFLQGSDFDDLRTGFEALLEQMKKTLQKTPELLPVLKEAGVVDSGGAGLVCFVEGMVAHLSGKTVEDTPELFDTVAPSAVTGSFGPDSVLEYGYCTEFILQLMNAKTDLTAFDLKTFLEPLEAMGDSIVAVANGGIVKLHIHTFTPEKVLEYGRRFGEFVTLKIENMSVQHSEAAPRAEKPKEHLKYAVVAVVAGEGITDYFRSIGANEIIDGGQTNNPSVDDFLAAFRRLDAEYIIVLPDNSNVVMTARQASHLYKEADVRVIPTKSVVEGCSALSMFNPWCEDVEQLLEEMSAGLSGVVTGYLTTAIRDTHMDGLEIQKGDYIGLDRETVLSCGQDKVETAFQLVRRICEDSPKEIIILFRGADATEEETAALQQRLETAYPCADIGLIDGKQAIYDFIISLE
jgi:DAK2 domain fusion protein YloV